MIKNIPFIPNNDNVALNWQFAIDSSITQILLYYKFLHQHRKLLLNVPFDPLEMLRFVAIQYKDPRMVRDQMQFNFSAFPNSSFPTVVKVKSLREIHVVSFDDIPGLAVYIYHGKSQGPSIVHARTHPTTVLSIEPNQLRIQVLDVLDSIVDSHSYISQRHINDIVIAINNQITKDGNGYLTTAATFELDFVAGNIQTCVGWNTVSIQQLWNTGTYLSFNPYDGHIDRISDILSRYSYDSNPTRQSHGIGNYEMSWKQIANLPDGVDHQYYLSVDWGTRDNLLYNNDAVLWTVRSINNCLYAIHPQLFSEK